MKEIQIQLYYHTIFKRSFTVLSKYSSFSIIISPVHNLRFAHSDQSPSWRTELGGVLISGLVRIGNRTGNVPQTPVTELCETDSVSSKCFRYLRHLNFNSSLRMVLKILLKLFVKSGSKMNMSLFRKK